jgi:sugar O-acyltransferase (sialic acid O-acetyltransferase NeuD family)
MDTLAASFGLPVGYSDHTEGWLIPVAAVARGARIIEKHFTLDRTLPGPDHKASLEPDELKQMIANIRALELAMGSGRKAPSTWRVGHQARRKATGRRRQGHCRRIHHDPRLIWPRHAVDTGLKPTSSGVSWEPGPKGALQRERRSRMSERRPHILLGAGGHARVVLALARALGLTVHGLCDPALAQQKISSWHGLNVLGGDEALRGRSPEEYLLLNGVGPSLDDEIRLRLYVSLGQKGFRFPALVHPRAWVDESVTLADGVQVMAGAVIQPGSSIGENTVINTNASVDHDCNLGAHVHIAPGATICGGVVIEDQAFVGSGATVIQNIRIGQNAVVAACTALVRNLATNECVMAAPIRKNTRHTHRK